MRRRTCLYPDPVHNSTILLCSVVVGNIDIDDQYRFCEGVSWDPDLASAEEEKNSSKQGCFESCEHKQEDEEGVLLLTVHPVFQTEILEMEETSYSIPIK